MLHKKRLICEKNRFFSLFKQEYGDLQLLRSYLKSYTVKKQIE